MSSDAVVLIPPLLCDARVFADQIGALSTDHPVIAMPTTQGDSIAAMADRVLSAAPDHFALVGAGMGGMIALEVINAAPERVTRIALINTTAQADTPKIAADRETQIIAATAGRFDDVIAHELDVARLHEDTDTAALAGLFRVMGGAVGAETYIRQTRALQKRKDQQGVLRKIRQPALVISGDSDPELPLRRQEFIAEMIPYATHEVIENTGAFPTLEQPERVSEILKAWARQPLVLR